MDSSVMLKQSLEYQKVIIDTCYNTMVSLQEQMEKQSIEILEKAAPPETYRALKNVFDAFKKNRDAIKSTMDKSFNRIESILMP